MKNKFLKFVAFGLMVFLPNLCFSAGIDRVNSFLNNLAIALYAVGVIVFTIALNMGWF